MASPKGTKTLERTGKLQSSSDFTGPRQGCDSSAHDHGKTPVAGRLHPINNVKQRGTEIALSSEPLSGKQLIALAQTWWAREDLNFRPHAYQARALTN
jgi:hypothetical protein